MRRSLTLVVHGESGVGKSYLADTSPGPRLVLDVEGGTRFTPSRKVPWDPRQPIPELGPDDSAVVSATTLDTVQQAFQWLNTSPHPFRSVIIDSLTEVQKRTVDAIAGTAPLTQQNYGELLRRGDRLVRLFRDMTIHPEYPVDVVVFVCGSREKGSEGHTIVRPALLGQMAEALGYNVDVMAYLSLSLDEEGQIKRQGLFAQVGGIAAKDRTGRLGVTMDAPSIPAMLNAVYGEE